MYFLNKSSSKEIYNFLISLPQKKKNFTKTIFYHKKFNDSSPYSKNIYLLAGIVTTDSKLRVFQFNY